MYFARYVLLSFVSFDSICRNAEVQYKAAVYQGSKDGKEIENNLNGTFHVKLQCTKVKQKSDVYESFLVIDICAPLEKPRKQIESIQLYAMKKIYVRCTNCTFLPFLREA